MPSLVSRHEGDSSDSESESKSDDDDVIVEDVLDGDEDLEDVIEADKVYEPLNRGLCIKRKPTLYETSWKGQKYADGVVNLTYRGNKYKMKDGVVHLNI